MKFAIYFAIVFPKRHIIDPVCLKITNKIILCWTLYDSTRNLHLLIISPDRKCITNGILVTVVSVELS